MTPLVELVERSYIIVVGWAGARRVSQRRLEMTFLYHGKGTCEACQKLILDFQEYTSDDDCVMICARCLDEERQERDMEQKMLHGC